MTDANPNPGKTWLGSLLVLPAIGAVLLPALTCPACWPAYAGLLSALGLGFVDYTPYLLPITIVFLALAVFSLGYRAKTRHGYALFFVGCGAAIIVIISKFFPSSEVGTYTGIAGLIGASIWNVWPVQKEDEQAGPIC